VDTTDSRAGARSAPPSVIPVPASACLTGGEPFPLGPDTAILVPAGSAEAASIGEFLAGVLRRSTGYPLPVRGGDGNGDGLVLRLDGGRDLGEEGYHLEVTERAATLRAHEPAGLFRGVQTVRQLLPAAVECPGVQPGPWQLPAGTVTDRPRYRWRGVMLDVARHFFGVDDVKRYLDAAVLYKINTLHLHLSDDQGWRIAIRAWPRLTDHGAGTEVGGGSGGYYTQEDYAEIVRYAAERHVTVVPEIDMPGHTNAALASYPELNPDGRAPDRYIGIDVGFSSLTVESEVTYRFLDDVVGEIAALTPGPYFHLGGDEAKGLEPEKYARFLARALAIVRAHGKIPVGWQEITAVPGEAGAIAQYWDINADTGTVAAAARRGAKLVLSPASRAYLDMKYDPASPLGLHWAGYVSTEDAYRWDPATLLDGVPAGSVLGVEAPLWTETLRTVADLEAMAYPRLPGIAEIGWSPAAGRSWPEYRRRLAAQAPRWRAMGVRYTAADGVPWDDDVLSDGAA
jgi:hexosaminidase